MLFKMGELTNFKQQEVLTPIKFLKVAKTQEKISKMSDERFNLGVREVFSMITPFLGLKKQIDAHQVFDIKKMLRSRFKHLSLQEIVKAFENERYSVYEKKTEHYQLFSSDYVSEILTKYEKWKLVKRKQNNLHQEHVIEMTDEEKKEMILQALEKQLSYFLETRTLDNSRIYVYDIFDKAGLMPTDINYKKSVHKDAIYILKSEYGSKKAQNKEEHKKIKNFLETVTENTINEEIKWKCKELALEDFLRKELKSEIDIQRLIKLIVK